MEWKGYGYISQCPFNSKELKYLFLSTFVTVLQNDPNLSAIPPQLIPQIFQTIFVATGCDYIAELVKPPSWDISTACWVYFQWQIQGTIADVGIEGHKINSGFLAFLRLVGTVNFKKHSSGFFTTPDRHFNKFTDPKPLQQQCSWYQTNHLGLASYPAFHCLLYRKRWDSGIFSHVRWDNWKMAKICRINSCIVQPTTHSMLGVYDSRLPLARHVW